MTKYIAFALLFMVLGGTDIGSTDIDAYDFTTTTTNE